MSKQSIIDALPTDFVRRMRNWAKAPSQANYAMTSAYDGARASSGYAESPIPTLIGESIDTHAALLDLPNRYRQIVSLFWSHEGSSMRWLARHCGCGDKTARTWLNTGHDLLRDTLCRRAVHYHAIGQANARATDQWRAAQCTAHS